MATKHNKPWLALVEEELDKASTGAAALVAEIDTNAVTVELWDDLEIHRDEVLGPEEPEEDIQLTEVQLNHSYRWQLLLF